MTENHPPDSKQKQLGDLLTRVSADLERFRTEKALRQRKREERKKLKAQWEQTGPHGE